MFTRRWKPLFVVFWLFIGLSVAVANYVPRAGINCEEISDGPAWDRDTAATTGILYNVSSGNAHWLPRGTTSLAAIHGYAHAGATGDSQSQANDRVSAIQIWGWRDTNGDGIASADDAVAFRGQPATTSWTLLSSFNPSTGGGDVVGWEVAISKGTAGTEHSALGDILQNSPIAIGPKESWLLIVRAVSITDGYTNFMASDTSVEAWDDGVASNGIGSDVVEDRYITSAGKYATGHSSAGSQAIAPEQIVWIYNPSTN